MGPWLPEANGPRNSRIGRLALVIGLPAASYTPPGLRLGTSGNPCEEAPAEHKKYVGKEGAQASKTMIGIVA